MKPGAAKILILCLLPLLAACEHRTEEASSSPPALRLPLTRVLSETIFQRVSLPATVTPLPDHSVKISSTIAGKLTAVYLQPGQSVSRGQVVATLDATQLKDAVNQAHAKVLEAGASVLQAQSALNLAKENQRRNAAMVQMRIGARKDLEAANSQVETAHGQVAAAQAQVKNAQAAEAAARSQLAYTVIRSPIAGIVAQRSLDGGEMADTATPIAIVEDLSQVVVSASLPTTQPANVAPGQSAAVQAIALPGRRFSGVVLSIDPMVQNNGTTIGVRILCANADYGLKDGMPVTAIITTAVRANALVVPSTALVDDPSAPQQKMVYVERDGKIYRVKVQVGLQQDGLTEITAGVKAGQPIVAAGAYGLPDGTRVERAKLAGTPGRIR